MRVWIVGDNFGFPNGTGATARVHGFVAALAASGAELRIFCATPTELPGRPVLNVEARGASAGVPFEYACGTTTLPDAWLTRRWLRVRSTAHMLSAARRARREGAAPDAVIATAQTISGLLLALATARAAGARCVLDACEIPSNFVRAGPRRRLHQLVHALLARGLDGVLCISSELERRWSGRAGRPTLRVPILADVAGAAAGGADGSHRIVYAGNLAHAEEVALLVEAFALVARAHPEARLEIFGDDPGTDAIARVRALAERLGVGERVALRGAVDRATAKRAMAGAAALALPRPRTPWSEAGFSAKLADYLATGRPVVTTGIGDIPLYLRHGESAFVVEPGDRAAFAAALGEALDDPARADAIGLRGREVALAAFDARVLGPRLAAFLGSLR